jgi:hypothetical protein
MAESGGNGGAIANADNGGRGTLTVSTNSSGNGGAIFNSLTDLYVNRPAVTRVSASTFVGNSGGAGGGAIADSGAGLEGGPVSVAADIFAGNCTQGAWHDEGYNVGSDRTCFDHGPGDVDHGAGLADLLGPLADNGGPTRTIRPLAGNPAIGLIPYGTRVELGDETVTLCPTTDQRGTKSSPGRACDGGALQVTGP